MKTMKSLGSELLFLAFLVSVGILSRVIPHPWNFTAIGAMALFSGFSQRSHRGLFFVPFLSLLISDLALGSYKGAIYVYGGFAVGMLISTAYFRQRVITSLLGRALSLSTLAVISSFLFFVITNFGAWKGNSAYTQDMHGLIESYVLALPFLFNQIGGDFFYGALIFGVHEYMTASQKNEALAVQAK